MMNKIWYVLVSIYYVSYLLLFLPLLLIFITGSNSYKRSRNKRKVRRIIRNSSMPKELRKEVTQSYKRSMKIFSIRKIISQNLFSDSKEKVSEKIAI
ncbi:MAG: hypothetical protein GOP50_03930 [Candidatus Heimdallarchaeota archaeon]|nr:hypothetical protein [Candidatus Heimdallarchaeota archaeon]